MSAFHFYDAEDFTVRAAPWKHVCGAAHLLLEAVERVAAGAGEGVMPFPVRVDLWRRWVREELGLGNSELYAVLGRTDYLDTGTVAEAQSVGRSAKFLAFTPLRMHPALTRAEWEARNRAIASGANPAVLTREGTNALFGAGFPKRLGRVLVQAQSAWSGETKKLYRLGQPVVVERGYVSPLPPHRVWPWHVLRVAVRSFPEWPELDPADDEGQPPAGAEAMWEALQEADQRFAAVLHRHAAAFHNLALPNGLTLSDVGLLTVLAPEERAAIIAALARAARDYFLTMALGNVERALAGHAGGDIL